MKQEQRKTQGQVVSGPAGAEAAAAGYRREAGSQGRRGAVGRHVASLLLAAVLSACGGGGGTAGSSATPSTPAPTPTPTPVPSPPAATASGNVVATAGTVVVGTEQGAQIAAGSAGNGLVVASGSALAPSLTASAPVIVPGGSASQFPLGLAGKVASRTTASDGSTTVVIQPATLSDVLTKVSLGSAPVSLDSSNFVGVISPSAVRAAAAAKTTAQAALAFDRVELGGGIRFKDARHRVRALAATSPPTDIGEILIDVSIPLGSMGIEPSKLRRFGRGGEAAFHLTGSLKDLKLRHNLEFEKLIGIPVGLKSMDMRLTGNVSLELKLQGGVHAEVGYFSQAWKEVEDVENKTLGAKVTGLGSGDKIGKYPVAGLVFSIPTASVIPISVGQTQTPLRAASPGGVIVWVYLNANGTIELDGAVGSRLSAGELELGLYKPEGQQAVPVASLKSTAGARFIEAPFVEGELNMDARLGTSIDLDVFVLGVRVGNAAVDLVANGNINVAGNWSFGTSSLADPWSANGSACLRMTFGAGAIAKANIALGAEIDTALVDFSGKYEYSGQWPSEADLLVPGFHGIGNATWFTANPVPYCFPKPVARAATVSATGTAITLRIDGSSLPDDIEASTLPSGACSNTQTTFNSPGRVDFSCTRVGTTPFRFELNSAKAKNLDYSQAAPGLRVGSGAIAQPAITVSGFSPTLVTSKTLPSVSTFAVTGTNLSQLTQIDFAWTGASGSGSSTWFKGDDAWRAGVVTQTDTSLSISRRVLAASGEPAGSTAWTMSFKDASGSQIARNFSVSYAPASTGFSVDAITPLAITAESLPLDAALTATGSGLGAVTQIDFSWSGAAGVGTSSWKKGDSRWSAGVVNQTNNGLSLKARLLGPQGEPSGWTNWTFTFRDATGVAVSKQITVTYAPPGAGANPTLSAVVPNPLNAGSTKPYSPSLTLSGTNLNTVTTIKWLEQGSLVSTWTKQSNGAWTTSTGFAATVSQSATSLGVQPTVVASTATWSGSRSWTVTVGNGAAEASATFVVNRNEAVAAPAISSIAPSSVNAGSSKPYAAALNVSGSNLSTVTSIKWLEQGSLVSTWTRQSNGSWTSSSGATVAVAQSATSLGVQPTVVASTDTWSGSRNWTMTVSNGAAEASVGFTVNRSEPVVAPTLSAVSPSPVNAGATKPYSPMLTLSGTNLGAVTTIKWAEQGSLVSTWTKQSNGSWTTSTGFTAAVTQTATSLGVQPTVVAGTDTWSGSRSWTVTVGNGSAEATASFTVNRTEPATTPTLSSVSPNPINAGTTKPYAPSLTLSGSNLNTVTTIKWLDRGSLVSTWTKQSNGSWTTSTGFTAAVTQTATSLGVQPTVVASTDTWSGSHSWTVTVGNGSAESSSSFTVNRTEPAVTPTLSGVSPNPINAGTTKPYAPSLTLSGSNLNTVTTIKWLDRGSLVSTWTKQSNGSWTTSTGFTAAVTQTATSLGVQPTVVASTDTWSGSRSWTVTVGNGSAESSSSFTVNRTEPAVTPTLSGVSPNPVNAGTTKPYAPSLTLSGSNLNTVTTIKWLEQGSLVSIWTKQSNGSWTTSTGFTATVSQTATSLGVQPTVVASTDTWSGSRSWTVTVGNGSAESSSSFTVNRTEPAVTPTLSSVSPNPINAGTTKPYAPSLTLSGSNLNTVNAIKWYEQGALVSTWTKQSNGSWTTSTGFTATVSQTATSLGVQPTVVASTDTWSGSRSWTVTVGNGSAESSSSFTVNRTEPAVTPTLSGVSPNPVNAGTTKPYAPSLTLSGSNLGTVNAIKWYEQGSLVSIWTKQSNGSWTTSTGFTAAVTQTATSLGVQPTVVASTDTWSGSRSWTVTVGNGSAESSSSFTVNRTEPAVGPNLTGVTPNPVNAGKTKPYAPSLTLSGTNLNTVTTIKWYEQGSLISIWTKQSNGSWTTSTGFTATVSQTASSLGVQPTVVGSTDTWSGSRSWTVTVGNGTTEASATFTVNRTN